MWAARYLTMNGSRRLIGSFTHGSMANAVSQAIGAQTAFPRRHVIALAGDGGLAMLLGELLTITQNELPVKIVVFNNSSLNFVEVEMKAAGFVNYGTDLENPPTSRSSPNPSASADARSSRPTTSPAPSTNSSPTTARRCST